MFLACEAWLSLEQGQESMAAGCLQVLSSKEYEVSGKVYL